MNKTFDRADLNRTRVSGQFDFLIPPTSKKTQNLNKIVRRSVLKRTNDQNTATIIAEITRMKEPLKDPNLKAKIYIIQEWYKTFSKTLKLSVNIRKIAVFLVEKGLLHDLESSKKLLQKKFGFHSVEAEEAKGSIYTFLDF